MIRRTPAVLAIMSAKFAMDTFQEIQTQKRKSHVQRKLITAPFLPFLLRIALPIPGLYYAPIEAEPLPL